MDWASKELVGVIYHLLPGFVAAWVFYALTPHPRMDAFERVVQALIFTIIVQTLTIILRELALLTLCPLIGLSWTNDVGLVVSVIVALGMGLAFARFANNDRVHGLLRRWGWTKRTSFPSEWYGAFHREQRWVILNLTGGRRLYGWPEEWPDHPDKGHFVITQPEWVLETGERAPVYNVASIVVSVGDVEMVELLKNPDEVTGNERELEAAKKLLVNLQRKEKTDGS